MMDFIKSDQFLYVVAIVRLFLMFFIILIHQNGVIKNLRRDINVLSNMVVNYQSKYVMFNKRLNVLEQSFLMHEQVIGSFKDKEMSKSQQPGDEPLEFDSWLLTNNQEDEDKFTDKDKESVGSSPKKNKVSSTANTMIFTDGLLDSEADRY